MDSSSSTAVSATVGGFYEGPDGCVWATWAVAQNNRMAGHAVGSQRWAPIAGAPVVGDGIGGFWVA